MIKKKEVKTYAYPTLLGYNIDDERNLQYYAAVPDLPELLMTSSKGATFASFLDEIKMEISKYLIDMKSRRKRIPRPSKYIDVLKVTDSCQYDKAVVLMVVVNLDEYLKTIPEKTVKTLSSSKK